MMTTKPEPARLERPRQNGVPQTARFNVRRRPTPGQTLFGQDTQQKVSSPQLSSYQRLLRYDLSA